MERRKRESRGFTLLEVMLVLGILGMTVFLGFLSTSRRGPGHRLQAAVWEINSRLNYARYKAILSGTPVRVKFSPPSLAVERYDPERKSWVVEETSVLEGVSVQANNTPTFHPAGTVSGLATITVSNPGGVYKITLAITGRVKVVKA